MKYLNKNLLSRFLLGLGRVYQLAISPVLPRVCRHYPSCSQYFIDSISQRGALRGLWLSVLRLLRCNPLFLGGYDPIK